jgi:nitrogen fixation-related uncharacterized protein
MSVVAIVIPIVVVVCVGVFLWWWFCNRKQNQFENLRANLNATFALTDKPRDFTNDRNITPATMNKPTDFKIANAYDLLTRFRNQKRSPPSDEEFLHGYGGKRRVKSHVRKHHRRHT